MSDTIDFLIDKLLQVPVLKGQITLYKDGCLLQTSLITYPLKHIELRNNCKKVKKSELPMDIQSICEEIQTGDGWVLLPDIFSQQIIEAAKDVVIKKEFEKETDHSDNDASQNNYSGLTWGLLSQGEVFVDIATHPLILGICRKILGDRCRVSSISANTVVQGMVGQEPHLDYPYHRYMWPATGYPATNIMSLTVVTLLTDFTPENGSTALIPGSQLSPEHPDNKEEFYARCQQVRGKAGDVMIIAGSLQHCAMPNKTDRPRSAILQQMVPIFVTPFEDIRGDKLEQNQDLRSILALDHEHPTLKYGTKKHRPIGQM